MLTRGPSGMKSVWDEDELGAAGATTVDLGMMVLDLRGRKTNRWTVLTEEPTGDEEADIARMLSQFKEKIAENISSSGHEVPLWPWGGGRGDGAPARGDH